MATLTQGKRETTAGKHPRRGTESSTRKMPGQLGKGGDTALRWTQEFRAPGIIGGIGA